MPFIESPNALFVGRVRKKLNTKTLKVNLQVACLLNPVLCQSGVILSGFNLHKLTLWKIE
jgi:hypothetical protein